MSGLVLKLGPHERVLINGAVVENCDRRTKLAIMTPSANILRLREAFHPDEANTPVRRICYMAQLILSGDLSANETRTQLLRGIEQLSQVLIDHDSRRLLSQASTAHLADQHYLTLKSLRALLPREERLLATGSI